MVLRTIIILKICCILIFFNEKALEYWKNIFSSDTCEKLSDQDIYKLLNWR